jgi:hypothetical protein
MKRSTADFHRTRQAWVSSILASKLLPMSAKVLAASMAMHFNYERWKQTGSLDAGGQSGPCGGLGFRRLAAATNMSHQTISRAQRALEVAGWLSVKRSRRKYDPATGQKEANCYVAQFTPHDQGEPQVTPRDQGEPQVTPRSHHQVTSRDQNFCSTTDQNIPMSSTSASPDVEAAMTFKNDNETRTKRREEDGPATIGDLGNGGAPGRQTPSFDSNDVDWVRNLIATFGDLTIQKIVAICREQGTFRYDIDGRQIAAMAKAGFLRRLGNLVWIDEECLQPEFAWSKKSVTQIVEGFT